MLIIVEHNTTITSHWNTKMKINELLDNDLNESILSRLGSKLISPGARSTGRAVKSAIGGSLGSVAEGAGDAVKLLTTLGLWFPFQQYFENMDNAEALVAAGQMTNDEYEEQHRNQLGILISTLAAAMVGKTIIKSAEAFLSLIKVIPIIGKPLSFLVGGLSNVAQLYFMKELVSDEGRHMLASFLTAGVLKGVGYLGLEAFPYFKKLVGSATEYAAGKVSDAGDAATGIAADPSSLLKQKHTPPAQTNQQTAQPNASSEQPSTADSKPTDTKPAKADSAPSKSSGFAPIGMKRDAQGNLVIDPDA